MSKEAELTDKELTMRQLQLNYRRMEGQRQKIRSDIINLTVALKDVTSMYVSTGEEINKLASSGVRKFKDDELPQDPQQPMS
ncbi:MAG: hypothetical protein KAQ85_00735 [Thermodesulfovibrionia bacterium]|nr:hypothetical protein [Thermodesulfovibrionia bacterium]